MSTVYQPITSYELTSFIETPNDLCGDYEALSEIIAISGSFLILREDYVLFVHQSAKDFILKEVLNKVIPSGIDAKHYEIFSHSL